VTALAFIVTGCAHPAMGKQWHTGLFIANGITADDVVVEFGDNSVATASFVNLRTSSCAVSGTARAEGRWRAEGPGVAIWFSCSRYVTCGSGEIDMCAALTGAVDGSFELLGDIVLRSISHRGLQLTAR